MPAFRYRKAADWDAITNVASSSGSSSPLVPIIGNGDILTYCEAERRLRDSGCLAALVGRGALIKPWIFQEVKEVRVTLT